MIAPKIGSVRSQRLELAMEGSSRSLRRSMSGPEPSFGAAVRVRRWTACCLKSWRSCGNRGLGNIVLNIYRHQMSDSDGSLISRRKSRRQDIR